MGKGIIIVFIMLIGSVYAAEGLDLSALMQQVDKTQMKQAIEMFRDMGKISKEEAQKALDQLDKMSDSEMDALKFQAAKKIKNQKTPLSVPEIPKKQDKQEENTKKQISMKSSSTKIEKEEAKVKKVEKTKKELEDEKLKEALHYLNN